MSADVQSREYQQMAHLLRRAGFGATHEEVSRRLDKGLDAAIHNLVYYDQNSSADSFNTVQDRLQSDFLDDNDFGDLQLWWLDRMVHTDHPLQEKMTLFWHGHFATAYSKVRSPSLLYQQNQTLRRNALGNFNTLTQAVSKDPAMIVYLDNQTNRKGHANENYGRELMELFTIGIGNYTEQDVHESARAFTGWTFNRLTGEYFFARRQHDYGEKTLLGHTGNWNGEDVVNILTSQPACSRFIATKLFKFFIHENPTPEEVQPFADTFTRSNLEFRPLLAAMFRSPAFYSDKAMWRKFKSPVEYIVGAARTTGVQIPIRFAPYALRGMSQELFNPPNVKGWDGGKAWINTTTLMARFNFAMLLARLNEDNQPLLQQIGQRLSEQQLATADDVVRYFSTAILQRPVSERTRQILVRYLHTGPGGSLEPFELGDAERMSRRMLLKVHGLMHVIMLTPEYQLC